MRRTDRLSNYTIDASGCWLWAGGRAGGGYGTLSVKVHGTRSAHRAVYIEHRGPIPDGMHIPPTCHVRACVNPAHHEPVLSGGRYAGHDPVPRVTLDDPAALRHLAHMKVRNLRPTSISNRRYVLARFGAWHRAPLLSATEDDLARWQAHRSTTLSAAALRMEMTGVQMFFRWCVREHLLDADPTARLDAPRMPRRRPHPITDPELVEAITRAEPRIRLILSLASFAGLRACEIARLDWADIDLVQSVIRVENGKGGHQRTVPMAARVRLALLSAPLPHTGPVIVRRDGRDGHVMPHRVSSIANDYLRTIAAVPTLHRCRAWFATNTYAACRDLRAVQDLMGHANPATTALYTLSVPGVGAAAVEAAAASFGGLIVTFDSRNVKPYRDDS